MARNQKSGVVFNATDHAIDLDDGRTLGPSETAEDVDLDAEHNRNLVLGKQIVVQDGPVPRTSTAHKAEETKTQEGE
jgi:hypothetical protein